MKQLIFVVRLVGVLILIAAIGLVSTACSPKLSSIVVTPSTPGRLIVGSTQSFTAIGTYSNGSTHDITNSVDWTSAATGTAAVDGNGLATSISNGTTNISASKDGIISPAVVLTVISLSSITVTPASPDILAVASTQQFTATATYSDGSAKDITTQVTWVSSDSAIAALSSTGSATAIAKGNSNITASMSGITSAPVPLISKTEFTPADVPTLLNLSINLPSTFSASYYNSASSAVSLSLLGTSIGSEFLVSGTVLSNLAPWYQIQCTLWVAPNSTISQVNASDALSDLSASLTPNFNVDVGSGSTAAGYGLYGSGLEMLMIKYQNAFVLLTAWYSHPQNNYVPLGPLGITIADRLNNYAY
jgi:hypothetical protein